ncbi:hypothetical protein KC19_2G185200 [Ceratodon purpureus]|uniref:Uncharacterized protein n=1 Tax=Ceratodon purpureus TaxID=3225 RepID=A0A8T0IVF2_CERPU|nr:hypothetical protein KC19_2G185200 [Ceratodon purpureus]
MFGSIKCRHIWRFSNRFFTFLFTLFVEVHPCLPCTLRNCREQNRQIAGG